MGQTLILIATNSDSFFKEASSLFGKFLAPDAKIESVTFHEILNLPKKLAPTAVLIDLSEQEEFVFSQIKRISQHFENSRIVCAGHPADVSLLLEFVRMGVKDFLKLPFEDAEVKNIIDQFSTPHAHTASKKDKAKIITFFSPKGGAGVTFVAANIGVALASDPKLRVAVCDFSPQCGDVATYLNLVPEYTFRDVLDNNTFIDASFLDGVMLKHATGVRVLPAPKQDQEGPNFQHLNVLESILSLLKKSLDVILVDGGHLDPLLLQYVMSESEMIFLLGNPDVVSLKGLVNVVNRLKIQGFDGSKIKVVINRYNSKSQIDTKEFERKTQHPITAKLPNNYMLCIEAVNTGQPLIQLQEKSDLSRKISDLAQLIREASSVKSSPNVIDFEPKSPLWSQSPFALLKKRGL